jgi:hypothetical protein
MSELANLQRLTLEHRYSLHVEADGSGFMAALKAPKNQGAGMGISYYVYGETLDLALKALDEFVGTRVYGE